MNSPLIEVMGVTKAYRMGPSDLVVLRGVDLTVQEGEFVAIMGASGSGKSTLLHIAGALDRPDELPVNGNGKKGSPSEVFFKGKPVSGLGRWGRHRLRNREFGFVFQFY